VVPRADPVSARKPPTDALAVFALIGQIARLADHERAAAKAEYRAGRDRLRQVRAGAAGGIAAEDTGLKGEVVARLEADTHAGRGQGIGRAGGGEVPREEGRPADAVVDEVRGRLALRELAVRQHQPRADGPFVVGCVLLVPERIKPCDRSRLEIGDREDIPEISLAEERAMGDEPMDVNVSSLPIGKLLQIDVELRLKHAEVDLAGPDAAADIGEEIVGIGERYGDAVVLEIGSNPAPIAGGVGSAGRGRLIRAHRLRVGRLDGYAGADPAERPGETPRPPIPMDAAHDPPPRSSHPRHMRRK
jgi:hypothetical protein